MNDSELQVVLDESTAFYDKKKENFLWCILKLHNSKTKIEPSHS
jgi:hypothetical protein